MVGKSPQKDALKVGITNSVNAHEEADGEARGKAGVAQAAGKQAV
jgi:hypothetical protein